jgi:hypothetical protein
MAFKLY